MSRRGSIEFIKIYISSTEEIPGHDTGVDQNTTLKKRRILKILTVNDDLKALEGKLANAQTDQEGIAFCISTILEIQNRKKRK